MHVVRGPCRASALVVESRSIRTDKFFVLLCLSDGFKVIFDSAEEGLRPKINPNQDRLGQVELSSFYQQAIVSQVSSP